MRQGKHHTEERDGQLPIAVALGAPISNQEQKFSLEKEPSVVKNTTLHSSSSNKYLLTSIQLCWKQSSLPSLILYEANPHPWQSWAPLNQNGAWGAAPANSGHEDLYSLKTCTALKGLWRFFPSLYLLFGTRKHKVFPVFPLHLKSKAHFF